MGAILERTNQTNSGFRQKDRRELKLVEMAANEMEVDVEMDKMEERGTGWIEPR